MEYIKRLIIAMTVNDAKYSEYDEGYRQRNNKGYEVNKKVMIEKHRNKHKNTADKASKAHPAQIKSSSL